MRDGKKPLKKLTDVCSLEKKQNGGQDECCCCRRTGGEDNIINTSIRDVESTIKISLPMKSKLMKNQYGKK